MNPLLATLLKPALFSHAKFSSNTLKFGKNLLYMQRSPTLIRNI